MRNLNISAASCVHVTLWDTRDPSKGGRDKVAAPFDAWQRIARRNEEILHAFNQPDLVDFPTGPQQCLPPPPRIHTF